MLASSAASALFTLVAIVGPGLALHRLLRVRIDPALVIPLGTAFAAGACWLSLAGGRPWLFPALVILVDLGLLLLRGRRERAPGPALRGALAPLGAVVLLLSATQYRWNRLGPDGSFVLDPLVPFDTAFHVGLTHELTLGYPPQVPGVSGFPLGYHLGADLVRAAALRWARVDPYDAITRLEPTVGALALVLLLRAATARLGGSPLAVALVPWTLLATDLSFVFAANPQAHWWTDLLRGNILLSLCLANPVVPALALALGAAVALSRHEAGEGVGWLALAAIQGFAVAFFKVFLGAHLVLGLGAALLRAPASRRRAILAVGLAAAVPTAALALGQGGRTVEVVLAPLDLVRVTRETLGLPVIHGAALAAWSVFWLVASLGLRVLGLPGAIRSLRGRSAAPVALAAMALAAWPVGLLLRVSAPEMLPGQKVVNDAAYLLEQGGPLLWIFTAMALAGFAAQGRAQAVLTAAAGLLALPSTAQFVVEKNRWPNEALPAPMVRAMDALGRASAPGDVVLQRPGARFPPAPVLLIGRRVPYERFTPWLTQFATREDLERRHETVYRFFRTRDRGEALAIARDLGARYLCLYENDRVRFDAAGILVPIHEEPGARVYRILWRPEPGPITR